MKNIIFTGESFIRIMRICGYHIVKDNARELLRYVYCDLKNDVVTAYGMNGYSMGYTTEQNLDKTEDFEFLLPVVKPPKNVHQVEIETDGKTVSIKFVFAALDIPPVTQMFTVPRVIDYPENIDKFFKRDEHVYSIGVNPKLLIETIKGFADKGEPVFLQFGNKVDPIYISTYAENEVKTHKRALVMPLNTKGVKE